MPKLYGNLEGAMEMEKAAAEATRGSTGCPSKPWTVANAKGTGLNSVVQHRCMVALCLCVCASPLQFITEKGHFFFILTN